MGFRPTLGAVPVPLRLTACGLVVKLPVMVSVPVSAPGAVGVNVTLIAQLLPLATGVLVLHVVPLVAIAKFAVPAVTAMPVKVKDPGPLLVTVTGLAALIIPTG